MGELNDMGCAGLADVAAELALGALTGHERAEALAHLDRCEACRESVRRLMMPGEKLLELLPAGESPPGFETGVLEQLGLSVFGGGMTSRAGQGGRLRRRPGSRQGKPGLNRRVLAVTAAVIAAAAAGLAAGACAPRCRRHLGRRSVQLPRSPMAPRSPGTRHPCG